ncbi:hypothetical protein WR25_16074 [Diploscapter pachys]|uniref:UDENN domain-containing protein n=1 Tax=Diploscapter pachys TaxID=2018661 RepID=A0A2A2KJ49_9BILA|nr:hypothetical protein WR25_16074 [Diploscapter pachys]
MPVHFQVYSQNSSLEAAWIEYADFIDTDLESDDEEPKSICSSSSMDEMVFASGEETETELFTKPLAEVNDVYKEPVSLELPLSESRVSIGSSISSGRSSPASSMSASAIDSEADFAKLAENLALKSNSEGDFAFDHTADDEDVESTPISHRKKVQTTSMNSEADTPTQKTQAAQAKSRIKTLSNSGEKVLGPNFMNAINGIGEKGSSVFSQVLNKTAPKAQALKEKTMMPLANKLEQSQHLVKAATQQNMTSTQTASQQSKNQQQVREYCDQVLTGQGIGMFAVPKLKRLMEDESLRELACSKLNLGLENKLTEDEFVKEIPLTRAQYKGYVKVLKACLEGIETCFNSPVCSGLASVFHVLEIAHTHFWAPNGSTMGSDALSPTSGVPSTLATPMSSASDSSKSTLPAASFDMRTPTKPVGGAIGTSATRSQPPNHEPPQLPPREHVGNESQTTSTSGPPPSQAPPPPPRPGSQPPPIAPRKAPPPVPPRPNANNQNPNQNPTTTSNQKPQNETTSGNSEVRSATTTADSNEGEKKPPEPKMAPPTSLPVEKNKVSMQAIPPVSTPVAPTRHYIYQELIMSHPNPIWQNLQFWENAFVDLVAQEREIVGMDQEPSEMIDRYTALNDTEKKRLELEEDRLLSTLLHNMTAYMVMCGTGQRAIQQKIRRLLGKAHIGLVCSKEINKLLDELPQTQGNTISLKPLGSRLVQKHSFTVYVGPAPEGPIMFMEVCDDSVVLRSVTGTIAERWWYERLVNMTYSPKTKVLCLWRRHEDKVHMHKFHTKKCRELYQCMKSAMERAAMRGKVSVEGRILGGEFPVHDTETNQGGLLQVRCDGIQVIFANSTQFIELANIKKCNTLGGTVFLLEEFASYFSGCLQAVTIAWALHRVFSVQYTASIGDDPTTKKAQPTTTTPKCQSPTTSETREKLALQHDLIFTDDICQTTTG